MAETLANGTVVPQGSDLIHASGVQAMRNMGGSVDAQLGNRSLVGHTHSWAQVTGKPTTFAPSAHSHVVADVTGLSAALDGAAQSAAWASVTGKPGVFPPAVHGHQIGDVDGLQDALDVAGGEAAWDDVTGKPTVFPPASHTHPQSDVEGLSAALAAIGYDSGERDITSHVPDVISGRLLVWRLGRTVHLTFESLVVSAPDTPHWLTVFGVLPLGFRGANRSRFYQFAQQVDSYAAGPIRVDPGGGVVIYNAKQGTGKTRVMQGTVAFPTPATLPATLPGTPA